MARRRVATAAEMEERLARAEVGTDLLPHMPAFDLEACEYCRRPDWEVPGNCLARVRVSASRLQRLLAALERIEERLCREQGAARVRSPEALRTEDDVREARRMLGEIGFGAVDWPSGPVP